LPCHGAAIVDTDVIARRRTGAAGGAMPAIFAQFGAGIAAADDVIVNDAGLGS
jgi:hypothetical protein